MGLKLMSKESKKTTLNLLSPYILGLILWIKKYIYNHIISYIYIYILDYLRINWTLATNKHLCSQGHKVKTKQTTSTPAIQSQRSRSKKALSRDRLAKRAVLKRLSSAHWFAALVYKMFRTFFLPAYLHDTFIYIQQIYIPVSSHTDTSITQHNYNIYHYK